MSDNSIMPDASVVRSLDKGGVKTQVTALDIGPAGFEQLLGADHPMPLDDAQLRATIEASSAADLAAQATTAQAVADLTAETQAGNTASVTLAGSQLDTLNDLLDTLSYLINELASTLPRTDPNGRMIMNAAEVTQPVSGTVAISSGTLTGIQTLGVTARPADTLARDMSNAAAMALYNNIIFD